MADIKIKTIKLTATRTTIYADETVKITATITPTNATNKTLQYTVSPNIAKVKSGVLSANDPYVSGTVTVTAKAQDGSGVSANCKIIILPCCDFAVYYKGEMKFGFNGQHPPILVWNGNDVLVSIDKGDTATIKTLKTKGTIIENNIGFSDSVNSEAYIRMLTANKYMEDDITVEVT